MIGKSIGIVFIVIAAGAFLIVATTGGSPLQFDPFESSGSYGTPQPSTPTIILVGSQTLDVGSSGKVGFSIFDFPEPGLGSWTIDIFYDPLLVEVDECTAFQHGVCGDFDDHVRFVGGLAVGPVGDFALGSTVFTCLAVGISQLTVSIEILADTTIGKPQPVEALSFGGSVSCGISTGTPGDVSCDDAVNSVDAVLILQFAAGLLAELHCHSDGDVNGDGQVDVLDATLILQFTAGLLGSLPP